MNGVSGSRASEVKIKAINLVEIYPIQHTGRWYSENITNGSDEITLGIQPPVGEQ